MPIYEYSCQECGHSLEAIQKLADAPLTDCPACDKPALKKQVSAPSFRLSGVVGTRPTLRPVTRRISRGAE